MILYSVTVSLPETLEAEWLVWQKEIHIPEVLATGFFTRHQMHKLLEPVMEADYVTYNILYSLDSLAALNTYREQHASALQRKHLERFGDQVFAVRSVMQICT